MRWAALLVAMVFVLRPVPAPAEQECPGAQVGSASCCCCGPETECCCWESDTPPVPPPTPAKVASSPAEALVAEAPVTTVAEPRIAASTAFTDATRPRSDAPPPFLLGCSFLC